MGLQTFSSLELEGPRSSSSDEDGVRNLSGMEVRLFFFFWLAHPCLKGGLLGDPRRKGARLLRLHYCPD